MVTLNLLGLTHRIPHIRKTNKDLAYCFERTDLSNAIFFRFIDFLEDFCKFIYMCYNSGDTVTKEMAQDWRRLFAFIDLSGKRYEFDIYASDVLGPWAIDALFSDFYKFFHYSNIYLCGQWPHKLNFDYGEAKDYLKQVGHHLNSFADIFHSLKYSFKNNTIIIKDVDEYYLNLSKENIKNALKEEFGESVGLDAFKNDTAEA